MAARNSTLEIVRSCVGRRHRITRTEMEGILLALAASGVSLQNGYVHDTMGTPFQAALAWAKMCDGITLVSVGRELRDGQVRYDEPGSMHPLQHSELTFAPDGMRDAEPGSGSTLRYLRRHADRVLIVREAAR